MTPYQHCKTSYAAGKSPNLAIQAVADRFLICDGDWNVLDTKTSFPSREAASKEIEKVRNRTRKFIS